MSATHGWTPASRAGIVPLHPLSFGTILGRSFTALRQNPRVLLGFALVVQSLAYVLTVVAIGAATVTTFSRLDTVPTGSDDFTTILYGSIVIVGAVSLVVGLPAGAVVVLVQGVVVAEVSAEVVAEKLPLGEVWRRVKPAAWRLIGWSALVSAAVLVTAGAVVGALVALGFVALPAAVILGILLALGAIPLGVWLSTKLLLVPAVLILERARLGEAVRRSWHLTRGRFWVAFGVVFVISTIFGVVAQVVSVPLGLVLSFLTPVLAPTGGSDVTALIAGLATIVGGQTLVLLVQTTGTIVQATATGLVYVDCRMRHEGLDLDLQAYVEKRDAGEPVDDDPYLQGVGREIAPRPTTSYGYGGYPAAPAYGGYPAPAAYGGYPAAPAYGGYPTDAPSPAGGPPSPWPPAAPPPAGGPPVDAPPLPPPPPAPGWTAPGADRPAPPESPWR